MNAPAQTYEQFLEAMVEEIRVLDSAEKSSGCCPDGFAGSGQAHRRYFQPPDLFFEGIVGVREDEGGLADHGHLEANAG